MTKAEEKELNDICSFYAEDKKMTAALKAAIIKHKSKYSTTGARKESIQEVFQRELKEAIDIALNNKN